MWRLFWFLSDQTSHSQTTTENEEEEDGRGYGALGPEAPPVLQTLSEEVAKSLQNEEEILGKVSESIYNSAGEG